MEKVFRGDLIKRGLKELASMMKASKYTVVLTGAGMDTESNIPDFRSENGWWKNIDPRTVANIDTFYENYPLFQEFYSMRLNLLEGIKPHKGHYILAELEESRMIQSIATQNVASLHTTAGSKKVYELHGNIRKVKCNSCGSTGDLESFINKESCKVCGDKALRPSVVLFGETLPSDAWNAALNDINKCDLLIVIGTSLEVYPVNQLPTLTKGKTVFINNEDRGANSFFDLTIIGKAKEVLEELSNNLQLKENVNRKFETIIEVGGEGGSVALKGVKNSKGNWIYFLSRNESVLWDLLDDEDKHLLDNESEEDKRFVTSWDKAIEMFDWYPWRDLYPLEVHEEFKDKVWDEVQSCRNRRRIEKWKEICSKKSNLLKSKRYDI